MSKPTIDISAVQLRRAGEELQVLIETDGVWRLAINRPWPADGAGLISHIAEANGKFGWPLVEPGSPPSHIPAPTNGCVPCFSCGGFRMESCKDYPNHHHDWCDCQ
jgi:hypothetical protein